MRWTGHVTRMGHSRGVYRVLGGKPEEKDHLEDPGVDERVRLSWIFRKWVVIDVAHDRYRWWARVNRVMKLSVHKMRGIS